MAQHFVFNSFPFLILDLIISFFVFQIVKQSPYQEQSIAVRSRDNDYSPEIITHCFVLKIIFCSGPKTQSTSPHFIKLRGQNSAIIIHGYHLNQRAAL